MGVLKPVRLVIENYPEGQVEEFETLNNPEDPAAGTRKVPFSRVLYIDQDDFRETPPPKYYRLAPGREVRLRSAYFVKCVEVVKDAQGSLVELRGTYDPTTRGGDAPDGRKVKATLHWVSAAHAVPAQVRLYDRLFLHENPEDVAEGQDFIANLNPRSLEVLDGCRVEPSLAGAGLRIAIVMSRFNQDVGEGLLGACTAELKRLGVKDGNLLIATVPGALELPLALQHLAQSGRYDALVALGCVVRGETYHFEIVSNESARGITDVQLQTGVPIANGVLTTEDDDQALSRMQQKGADAAQTAVEMAHLIRRITALGA